MIAFMRLCQKHQIHLLSDEIYALTTFPTNDITNPTPFTSLLSIDKTGIIDPSLCHVIHGMSKVLIRGICFLTAGLLLQRNSILHVDFSSESLTSPSHPYHRVYLRPRYLILVSSLGLLHLPDKHYQLSSITQISSHPLSRGIGNCLHIITISVRNFSRHTLSHTFLQTPASSSGRTFLPSL
jgi:hypothetical protein